MSIRSVKANPSRRRSFTWPGHSTATITSPEGRSSTQACDALKLELVYRSTGESSPGSNSASVPPATASSRRRRVIAMRRVTGYPDATVTSGQTRVGESDPGGEAVGSGVR